MCAYEQNPKPAAVWGHGPTSPRGDVLSASWRSTSDGWRSPSTLLSAMENVVRTTYPVPGSSLQRDKASLGSVHSRLTCTASGEHCHVRNGQRGSACLARGADAMETFHWIQVSGKLWHKMRASLLYIGSDKAQNTRATWNFRVASFLSI